MSESYGSIHSEKNGSIALLRMERGKVNAIDVELLKDIQRSLNEIEKSDIKAVVFTGTGKAFSAGVDLFRLLEAGQSYIDEFLPLMLSAFEKFFTFPKPVVAAVNGHAIAGGCILTCACDYRMMAAGPARIGITEMLVGVPFPSIALEVMRFSTPPHFFQKLVYSGQTCSPDEALSMGLIDEVVDSELLIKRAIEKAAFFSEIPSASFAEVKRQMRKPAMEIVRQSGAEKRIPDLWNSAEVHRKIRDYLHKTIGKNR